MFKRFLRVISAGLVLLTFISVSLAYANTQRSVVIIDDIGRKVRVNLPVQRIVSIAPSATEIVFALGAQNLLVGRTDFCNYPKGVSKIPSIGGAVNPSPERIIASRPQLILTTRMFSKAMAEPLMRAYPLVVLEPQNVEGVLKNILNVGKAIDRVKESRELVASLNAFRRPIRSYFKDAKNKPTVLVLVWHDPLITVGPGSFIASVVEEGGGLNYIRKDIGAYPIVSPEALLHEEPDIVLYPTKSMGIDPSFLRESPFKHLKAVKEGRVFPFDDDLLFRPGPRVIQGMLEVSKAIDPVLRKSRIFSLSTLEGKLYQDNLLVLPRVSLKNLRGRVHVTREAIEVLLNGYLKELKIIGSSTQITFKDGRFLTVSMVEGLLPLRRILEFMDFKLFWDNEFKEVHIFSKP
ncbi:MAG: High-affinity heme uptake system protein IsdE [candidate division WS2 bacterium]|nr:High-affinity heme uptake system protein IsdE [Candidatus Psychracetigena formicireducens]